MPAPQSRDIAVIGAGVAGLATALLLARQGHRVRLLERFDTPRPLGAGLLLQPTGLAALARLGLHAEIAALGAPIHRLEGRTRAGRPVFDVRYDTLSPGLAGLGVHRAMLHAALWRGFAASGAALETGCEITSLAPAAGGGACPVDARGRIHPRADLVVDASGAGSPLRPLLGTRPARPFAFGAMWAVLPHPALPADTLAQRYDGARIMMGLLPVGRTEPGGPPLAALFWSLPRTAMPAWAETFPAWQHQAATLWPDLAPSVAALRPEAFTPALYGHYTAARPCAPGLVLVGDAAHATSPQLGQGANQALLDAVTLADCLAVMDTADAIARYAALRRSHVRFYQWASRLMTPLFQSGTRTAGWLRDLAFPLLPRLPWLRREMVRTLAGLKTGPLGWQEAATLAARLGQAPE